MTVDPSSENGPTTTTTTTTGTTETGNYSNNNNKATNNSTNSNQNPQNNNNPQFRRTQAPPNVYNLELTLEELYSGVTKRMRIQRNRFNEQGKLSADSRLLEIHVKPGWKHGTRITFAREGDEHFSGNIYVIPADIVFVIVEKPHERYTRKGDHLLYTHKLPLKDALCGPVFAIKTLDGRTLTIDCKTDPPIAPRSRKRIPGEGMPCAAGTNTERTAAAPARRLGDRV